MIRSAIEACIESVHKCRRDIKNEINNDQKFTYSMLFFDKEKYFGLLSKRRISEELSFHFSHSHYLYSFHNDAFYIDSDPFKYIFESKLNCKIPQTEEESKLVIKQIQEICIIIH